MLDLKQQKGAEDVSTLKPGAHREIKLK